MGRAPCCDKTKVKRGPWSPEEDATLRSYLERHGTGGNWIALPHKAGLRRCGKSCRLRWLNYLRPDIKHGCFTQQEDNIICTLYNNIGSRWSVIASHLPGRTDNDVKNYWNTKLKKKLLLHVQSTTTTTQELTPPALIPRPVPKVEADQLAIYSTPNFSAGMGMGSSYDDELILSELIPDPPSFPIMQSTYSSMILHPLPQSTTDDHLANTTAVGVLPPEDGYNSSTTTTSSTSADPPNWSTAINACSGATGGQSADDLFLQELGFGSYTSTSFLAGHGGFGELLLAPLNIYSSSSSTKPQGIIYQNVTNY